MVKNIFIIITPFQLAMMKQVFGKEINREDSLILFSENVELNSNKSALKEQVDFGGFSIHELKKHPLTTIKTYRSKLKAIKLKIIRMLDGREIELSKVIIGTDKDNFTQVFLEVIFSKYVNLNRKFELHAVEEGLGYYMKEGPKDTILKILYRWLTPSLFGQRIEYHKLLATDKRIDTIHMRLPELRPRTKSKDGITVQQIPFKSRNLAKSSKGDGKKVLIYSFPNQDYAISDQEKYDIYKTLIDKLKGYDIFVKPHPRESIAIFDRFPEIGLLPGKMIAEEMNYFEYSKIVNFTSSVIIDILQNDYPADQVYTIFMKSVGFSLFDSTRCIWINKLDQLNFEI